MAHINADEAKAIRQKLKKEFPNIKFSVTRDRDEKAVNVCILKSDIDFSDILDGKNNMKINKYYPENYGKHESLIKKIDKIIRTAGKQYYDNSDARIDYFDVAFWYEIFIGKRDKPYIQSR